MRTTDCYLPPIFEWDIPTVPWWPEAKKPKRPWMVIR
jgi:hypothetical protein